VGRSWIDASITFASCFAPPGSREAWSENGHFGAPPPTNASDRLAGPITCGFMSGKGDGKHADPREEGAELFSLLRRYVVQETVAPLRSVGRTLLFGSLAALFLGIGTVLLLLALLRVLQTETGTAFAGTWSWVPYPITAILGLVTMGATGGVLLKSRGKRAAERD
jgi:hypothetical protein